MVKHIKQDGNERGLYLLTRAEAEAVIEAYQNQDIIELNSKQYYPIRLEPKYTGITKEEFEDALKSSKNKKALCAKLNTTYYKLHEFIVATYGCDKLNDIRLKIFEANKKPIPIIKKVQY